MKEITITKNEAGQRFDKYLFKYFKEASSGFIYKMLRKKNITLNGKKSDGKDKLSVGDTVKIFMADDTIDKFTGNKTSIEIAPLKSLDIVYEDRDVIIVNKPSGMLSQKADNKENSINEYIISYLINSNQLTIEELKTFKPGVCNRLDRNTSGLIVAGKSLFGLQFMSKMFKERTMDKYYLALVSGKIDSAHKISSYLVKDEKNNKVTITDNVNDNYIETEYEPLASSENLTLLKVKLITGKPHQIRAHLASVNHGIIGDYKYGNKKINDSFKSKYGIKNQLLHAWKLDFGVLEGSNFSNKEITADLPSSFEKIISNEFNNFLIGD